MKFEARLISNSCGFIFGALLFVIFLHDYEGNGLFVMKIVMKVVMI